MRIVANDCTERSLLTPVTMENRVQLWLKGYTRACAVATELGMGAGIKSAEDLVPSFSKVDLSRRDAGVNPVGAAARGGDVGPASAPVVVRDAGLACRPDEVDEVISFDKLYDSEDSTGGVDSDSHSDNDLDDDDDSDSLFVTAQDDDRLALAIGVSDNELPSVEVRMEDLVDAAGSSFAGDSADEDVCAGAGAGSSAGADSHHTTASHGSPGNALKPFSGA
jgi:hypothetical protein